MEGHDVRQAVTYIRASISDCLATLREYEETDFGFGETTFEPEVNLYRRLLERLAGSLYYVIELSHWINRGVPDQR